MSPSERLATTTLIVLATGAIVQIVMVFCMFYNHFQGAQ